MKTRIEPEAQMACLHQAGDSNARAGPLRRKVPPERCGGLGAPNDVAGLHVGLDFHVITSFRDQRFSLYRWCARVSRPRLACIRSHIYMI